RQMGRGRQREGSQRVDGERERETPPAEIERQAVAQIARGFQYGEREPPDAVTPQAHAADHAPPEGRIADAAKAVSGKDARRVAPEQDEAQCPGSDRSKRQPSRYA